MEIEPEIPFLPGYCWSFSADQLAESFANRRLNLSHLKKIYNETLNSQLADEKKDLIIEAICIYLKKQTQMEICSWVWIYDNFNNQIKELALKKIHEIEPEWPHGSPKRS